jgi:predicted alpha/beta superfamily hydrolase
MKATILLFILFSIFFDSCISVKSNSSDNRIVLGSVDSLYSNILKESRQVWVYVPAEDNLYAKQSYPVVYLLDGDAHYYSVMGIIQQLSEVNMNMVLPKMILVGITNTHRTRDLTPSNDSFVDKSSGGAENFTLFLEKELIPYIDLKYPTKPYRLLIGHSLGGLFCVNTLLKHTKLFNGYLSIDPSLFWDNKILLKEANELLASKNYNGTSFYLSIANQGYSDNDTLKDNAAAFDLAKYLDSNNKNSLRYSWHYYKDDNHGSVPLISEYDGLRFLFDFYNPKISYTKFRDPSYDADSFINVHFTNVSKQMGYSVPPPEPLINWLGYLFIMEKQYNKAHNLLKRNIENYPGSANAYDSMGEILMLMGDTISSIENYEKSLKLNPNNKNAKKMLKQLKIK